MQYLDHNWDLPEQNQDQLNQLNQPNTTNEARPSILDSMKQIDKLDKYLNDIYKDTLLNNVAQNLVTDKIQRFEIEDFGKNIQNTRTKYDLPKQTNNNNPFLDNDDIKKVLNTQSSDLLSNIDTLNVNTERKKRYNIYEEVTNINFIAGNMLTTYLDSIFVKNIQTKRFINIQEKDDNLNNEYKNYSKKYKNLLKTIKVFFDIENKLKNIIVPKMLTYGNYYLEVVNLKDIDKIINSKQLLQESSDKLKTKDFQLLESVINIKGFIPKNINNKEHEIAPLEESENIPMEISFEQKLKNFLKNNKPQYLLEENLMDLFNTEISKETEDFIFEKIEDLDIDELNNLQVKTVDPSNVIIIEDDNIRYGYLIINDDDNSTTSNEIDIYKRFMESSNKNKGSQSDQDISTSIVNKISDYIHLNILELIRKSYHQFKLNDLQLPQDSLNSIKSILYSKIKEKSKLNFRFLSTNNLINFSMPINKFAPYGTSIFDPVIQPIKLFTLAQISSIISRLSRAAVIRKWTVEAGAKKNHSDIIETLRRDLKTKSVSYDTLSNIKNVTNVLTDFRDIATIKVDGNSFIDMEIVPTHDRSLPLNDLNDLKADIISASGIPAVYLNMGDQVDLRETLVNLNTVFAQKILNIQSGIEEGLDNLFSVIFTELLDMNNKKNNTFVLKNYYQITLNAPLVLQIQSNEALISSITNIIGLFKQADFVVDPKFLYKKFIPNINWDEFEDSGKEYINNKAKQLIISSGSDGSNF